MVTPNGWLAYPLIMKGKYLLPILTGILVGTSYIPFPPWSIFFCLVPLWISWLRDDSAKGIFWTGWTSQFVFNLIGFNWVAHTLHEFGHLPWVVTIPLLFLFCALTNLYIPLAGLLWNYLNRRLKLSLTARIWLLPVLFGIFERIFPMIFDWHFGYGWLWGNFPAKHLADIFGFLGLSTLTLLANAMLLHAWWLWKESRSGWIWRAASVPAIFSMLNVAGHFHGLSVPKPDSSLKFLIVQANIENQEKLLAETGGAYRDVVLGRFTSLSQKGIDEAKGQVDFVVWPETSFPDFINSPDLSFGYATRLRGFIMQSRTKMIVGAWSTKRGTRQDTNSFFVIDENARWMDDPYHKTILLAFGEYVPLLDHLPYFKRMLMRWIPEIGDYGRGPGPTVVNAGEVRLGAQICYEGLFDWFSRALANKGAQVIVNLTNDSWYGTWEQPYQHLYMTLVRAIETRRPLVRSTNTGISTVILANGDVMETSPLHQEWYHLYDVPYLKNPPPTIFMGWGFWIFPAFLALAFVTILVKGRSRR